MSDEFNGEDADAKVYQAIPVIVARMIAEKYAKNQVVILAWDAMHGLTHTTTYGVSAFEKENAAAVGAICTKAIGADLSAKQTFEDFHDNMDPALYREALELLRLIRNRQGCTGPMLQSAERILKAAGFGVRHG